MAFKLHIPQFNDDIYFTETWYTRGVSSTRDILLGEQPIGFNAFDQVLPHRGANDYNSGWVSFLILTDNNFPLYYRIIYDATNDIGYFDVADYSEGINHGIRMKFDFTVGVQTYEKYLHFRLHRGAWTTSATLQAPGPYYLYISQWLIQGGIGTWNEAQYNYTSNNVDYEINEFYNGAGPWVPTFPQTQESAWTQENLPGVCGLFVDDILYNIPETSYHDWYTSLYFGENWNPLTSIKNSDGQPLEPGEYDPNDNDPAGPSKPGGGDGGHKYDDDQIPLPDLPDIGAADAGMITLYKMSPTDMLSFTQDLWRDGWTQIKAFFADPMDFIIGCLLIPFSPTTTRSAKPKFGIFTWSNAYPVITNEFYTISCGSVEIPKFYGSCFDYNPYTKVQIWLPFVGMRDLPTDKVMGKEIAVTYHVDMFTGDCIAFVHTPSVGPVGPQRMHVIGQFPGNVGVRVPLSRISYDAAVSAGIQLLGGAVGMVAGGLAMAAGLDGNNINASQIANQASAATVGAVNAGKTRVERSGTIGASTGSMGVQYPYIIRTIPRQSLPANQMYPKLNGYPANLAGPLSKYSGFTAVESIKLETQATEEEKEMIISMLRGGVYL